MRDFTLSKKLLLFGLFLLVMSLVSELIFLTKQGELSKIAVYPRMQLAKQLVKTGNIPGAFHQVEKAAEAHERYILLTRYSFIPQEIVMIPTEVVDDPGFQSVFAQLLEAMSVDEMIQTEEANLSLLYYRIGLGLGESDAYTEWFLKKATALAPELSFYHVELANYYWLTGRLDDAVQALQWCERFNYPVLHCTDFARELTSAIPYSFGFMSTNVEEYYANFKLVRKQ